MSEQSPDQAIRVNGQGMARQWRAEAAPGEVSWVDRPPVLSDATTGANGTQRSWRRARWKASPPWPVVVDLDGEAFADARPASSDRSVRAGEAGSPVPGGEARGEVRGVTTRRGR